MPAFISLIFLLAALLRGSFITISPPEMFGDELDVGYQSYSLLKTGRDLYGQVLPTYIHSLSEWRAPLLMYFTVPSVAMFGLNEWGVRAPEIILGILSVVLLYLLVKKTLPSGGIAAWSSLLLAVMPWHLYYSRAAFESVLLLDLILLGTILYLRRSHLLAYFFFALSIYTYSTAIVFVPLWLIVLYLHEQKKPRPISFLSLVILVPFVVSLFSGVAGQRFGLLSIFKSEEVVDKIVTLRNSTESTLEPAFHNKVESWGRLFFNSYVRAFSTDFLFVRGDPVGRHSIQVTGQLLPVMAPLVAIGLFVLAQKRQWLFLAWLLIAPIPSALTTDGAFHATRLFLLTAPLAVAAGLGLHVLSKNLQILFTAMLFLNFIWFGHYYLVHYPRDSSVWWSVGYKEVMQGLAVVAQDYPKVYINNTYEPALIRFLFYTKYPPDLFHSQFTGDNPSGFSLGDKYIFGKSDIDKLEPGSLYVLSQRDDVSGDWDWRTSAPQGVLVLYTSTDLQNRPLFYVVAKQ